MTNPERRSTHVPLRLLAATVAIVAGITAVVIALLFLKAALG
jgi:hypothetical protein